MVEFYRRNGCPDKVACTYWPTGHFYDRPKRERTYWWMEKWLRQGGSVETAIPTEPAEIQTVYPMEVLSNWPVANPNNEGFGRLVQHFRDRFGFTRPVIETEQEWTAYRQALAAVLPELLGLRRALAPTAKSKVLATKAERAVTVADVLIASEGPLCLPAQVLRPRDRPGPWPVTIVLSKAGAAPAADQLARYVQLASAGHTVILPAVRFSGVYHLPDLAGLMHPDMVSFPVASQLGPCQDRQEQQKNLLCAWERNSVCWGYPLIGMTVTDLRAVLRFLDEQDYADVARIDIETRDLAHLALAAVCAAIDEPRIGKLAIDLNQSQYRTYQPFCDTPDQLPVVPFIMRYGDVAQWVALLADRQVTLRNLAQPESEGPWLQQVFAAAGNPGGLTMHSGQAPAP